MLLVNNSLELCVMMLSNIILEESAPPHTDIHVPVVDEGEEGKSYKYYMDSGLPKLM